MKNSNESCQLCGVLCLNQIIDKLNYFIIDKKYFDNLYEKLLMFLDNENFPFKEQNLTCLEKLIKKCENSIDLYKDSANVTLYKVLDYLAVNNNGIICKALDVVYLLISNCNEELSNLEEQLKECLNLLQENNTEPNVIAKCKEILELLEKENKKEVEIINNNSNTDSLLLSDIIVTNGNKGNNASRNVNSTNKAMKINDLETFGKKTKSSNSSKNKFMSSSLNEKVSNYNKKYNSPHQRKNYYYERRLKNDLVANENKNNVNTKYANKYKLQKYRDDKKAMASNFNNKSNSYRSKPNNFQVNSDSAKKKSIFNTNKNQEFFEKAQNMNGILIVDNMQKNQEENSKNQSDKFSSDSPKNISPKIRAKKEEYNLDIILKQMKDFSDKQIQLLNSLENIQKKFFNISSELTNRITNLEKKVEEKYFSIEGNKIVNDHMNNQDYLSLINYYTEISIKDLKEINIQLVENSIIFLFDNLENYNTDTLKLLLKGLKKIFIGTQSKLSEANSEIVINKLKLLLNGEKEENIFIEVKLLLSYLESNVYNTI